MIGRVLEFVCLHGVGVLPKTLNLKESFMSNSIEAKVKAAVAEQLSLNADEIDNGASFMDDLGADSLDLVELVMAFENEFGITIPDEDSNELTTVQKAIDYVSAKL